jgi:hypothetical protein
MLMTRQQATQRLIARTLDIQPPRVAQHHHKELHAHPLRANLGPGTPPIDLRLAPGSRFKAQGGLRQPIAFRAQRSHGQLHHLIAAAIAQRLQLLEEPIGIVVHLRHPTLDVL